MLILIKRMSDHPSSNLSSLENSQTSPIIDIVAAVDTTNVNSNKENATSTSVEDTQDDNTKCAKKIKFTCNAPFLNRWYGTCNSKVT